MRGGTGTQISLDSAAARTSVHDAPRDVDEVFDDLFDEKVPNVSQSDWAVAVHPEGIKR